MIQIVAKKNQTKHSVEESIFGSINNILHRIDRLDVQGMSKSRLNTIMKGINQLGKELEPVVSKTEDVPRYQWEAWRYHSINHIVCIHNPETGLTMVIKKNQKSNGYTAISIEDAESATINDGWVSSIVWCADKITTLVERALMKEWIVCVHSGTPESWLKYFQYIVNKEYK